MLTGATCHGDKRRTTQYKILQQKEKYKGCDKMSKYINFTKEQREQARRTDLANFLISQGEKVKKSGSEYEWLDGSQKVTIRGHLWYHQYEQIGGDAVDFVRRFYNKDYAEAVEMLLNNCGGQIITSPPIEISHKPFELPPRNDRMSRVFSYLLLTRGIDKDVLYEFVRNKMIYESADYHNAVFVGYDSSGKPRHAHKRGTVTSNAYKGNVAGSQPEFSFHWHGTSDKLFLFEAPIDMLSYISMQKAKDLQKVLTRENELKYNKTLERELAVAACRWKIIAMRHPVPFRTECFFNVCKTIRTSKMCFSALTMTRQDRQQTNA